MLKMDVYGLDPIIRPSGSSVGSGRFSPDLFLPEIYLRQFPLNTYPSILHGVWTFPFPPPPSADLQYKAIPLMCTKLIEVDRLRSGGRVSAVPVLKFSL